MSDDRQSATELGPLVSQCDHQFGAHSGIGCLAALRECPDLGMPLKGGDILLRACEALLRKNTDKRMRAYLNYHVHANPEVPSIYGDATMSDAIVAYAKTFPGGALIEGEPISAWFARTAPKLTAAPHERGMAFFALLRASMKVAFDLTDKDLDDLITQPAAARAPQSPTTSRPLTPAPLPASWAAHRAKCSMGASACIYPHGCPDPVHKGIDPMCKGAVSHQPHANPAPPTQAPTLSLGDRRKLVEEAKKLSGWKGSDALPYDSDYD